MKLQLLVCAFFSMTCLGCGGGPADQAELAPVEGVVLLEGEPVKNAVVTFYPEKGPSGVARGNEQGEFTVMTNGEKGAPVGKCKVTVVSAGSEPVEMDGNEGESAKDETINPKYASAATTDLVVDVTAEGQTDLKLELKK